MTWGWSPRGPMQASLGGARGTPAEAARTKAWPSYEAEYLQNRLGAGLNEPSGKYDALNLTDDAARSVYLDKVTENYKTEADECLKAEFKDWLQGLHEDNVKKEYYKNKPGAPVRRYTYHTDIPLSHDGGEKLAPGDEMKDDQWQPTWWGRDSLTHLPGVREFLRGEDKSGWENDFQMNMLAEHGPQDVEQAWQYFKHWVKGRPMTDAVCLAAQRPPISDVGVNAGRVGPINHMRARPSMAGGTDGPDPLGATDLAAGALFSSVNPSLAASVAVASVASGALEGFQSETASLGTANESLAATNESSSNTPYVPRNNQLLERGADVAGSAARNALGVMQSALDAGHWVGGQFVRGVANLADAVTNSGEGEADDPVAAIPVGTLVDLEALEAAAEAAAAEAAEAAAAAEQAAAERAAAREAAAAERVAARQAAADRRHRFDSPGPYWQ